MASGTDALQKQAAEHERGRNWPEFIAVCQQIAAHADPPKEAVTYLQKAAMASEQHLHDHQLALDLWTQIHSLDSENRYAYAARRRLHLARDEFDAVEQLARERGSLRDCIRLFEGEVDKREGDGRRDLLLRLAGLYEAGDSRSDINRAVAAYEKVRELEPQHPEAIAALARLYEPSERPSELAAVLWSLVETADDPMAEVAHLRRIADLAENSLKDAQQATTAYQGLVDRAQDLLAVSKLVSLYVAAEDFAAIDKLGADCEAVLAAPPETDEERAAFVTLVAQLTEHRERFSPIEGEASWSARAIALAPGDVRLAAAYDVAAAAETDSTRRADLSRVASESWRSRGDASRAYASIRVALAARPSDDAVFDELERVAAVEGRFAEVAEIYRETAGQPLAMDDQIRVRLRLARIYGDELGEIDRAIRTYERVKDLSSTGQGVQELERLLAREGRLEELARVRGTALPETAVEFEVEPDHAPTPSVEPRPNPVFEIEADEDHGSAPSVEPLPNPVFEIEAEPDHDPAPSVEPLPNPVFEIEADAEDDLAPIVEQLPAPGLDEEFGADPDAAPQPIPDYMPEPLTVPVASASPAMASPPTAAPPTAAPAPNLPPAEPAATVGEPDVPQDFDGMMANVLRAGATIERDQLRAFERLATESERWEDYALAFEQIAAASEHTSPARAIEFWLLAASAHEVRRDDTGAALLAVERASALEPERTDLLVRRMELHRRRNEWEQCDNLLMQISGFGQ